MQSQRCLPLGAAAAKQSPASPKGPGFVARTRGKQPSDRSGRCLRALVRLGFLALVFRARGGRSSPHSRRLGTAGRERPLWGLGLTARRSCRKGCRSVVGGGLPTRARAGLVPSLRRGDPWTACRCSDGPYTRIVLRGRPFVGPKIPPLRPTDRRPPASLCCLAQNHAHCTHTASCRHSGGRLRLS